MSTSERGPDALLPLWAARLLGFAALASLGALEWQRMVAGLSSGRALLWVASATAAGALVLACDRLPSRLRGAGVIVAAVVAVLVAIAVSGIPLELLKPRNWRELVEGVVSGAQSLGTVRMPYDGADPWPRAALELLGSLLLTAAALLTCWPRGHDPRLPVPGPDRPARAGGVARRLARRHAAAAARGGDRGAHGLLPLARAAAAAAGGRRRCSARRGPGGRAAACRGGRPRRAVVRLQGVRRGARPR